MSRSMMRYMIFLCALFVLASVGGVFATWIFTFEDVEETEDGFSISLSEFEWKPEQILPTESEIGENHVVLVELILNENKKGYGLNYDNKHVLESYLNSKGLIFSNQKTTGGNMKFVSDESDQLYYCVEKVSDTVYHAYTFAYSDLSSVDSGSTATIPVYKTVLEKTDIWRAPRSYFGYAQTKSLSYFSAANLSGTLSYSIDPSTWTPSR